MDVRFYELSQVTAQKAVPQLLYKIYEQMQKKIFLLLEDSEQVAIYDKLLWVFSSNKFLPHGTIKDSKEHYEQLLISDQEENLNQAEVILTTKLPNTNFLEQFAKQIFIFNIADNAAYIKYFQTLKNNNVKVNYWQQDKIGKWFQAQ